MADKTELACAADLKTAIAHIEAGTPKFGIALLSKYRNCKQTNQSCRYSGGDCAIPEIIEGFYRESSAA